jgi:predicted signal transduction protein with EAL and GGDEF domain
VSFFVEGTKRCAQLQQALTGIDWLDNKDIHITCSMGFSAFPLVNVNFEDWEAALKLADYGLYEAKNNGKNHWFGFEVNRQDLSYDDVNDIPQLITKQKIKRITDLS